MEASSLIAAVDYDIIFIGQLGAVVASMLKRYSEAPIKGLLLINRTMMVEPSLLPTHSPVVTLNEVTLKNYDVEPSEIYKLFPDRNLVAMENKKVYHYRYLVYTADAEEWAN